LRAQHERLIALRAGEPGFYYCAPLFYKDTDYWAKAYASAVWSDSALLDVNDFVPASFVGPHAITYDATGAANVWSHDGYGTRREREEHSPLRVGTRQRTRAVVDTAGEGHQGRLLLLKARRRVGSSRRGRCMRCRTRRAPGSRATRDRRTVRSIFPQLFTALDRATRELDTLITGPGGYAGHAELVCGAYEDIDCLRQELGLDTER
jgi:hypothetical protein